jgi:hypothetical protein
MEIRS